MMRTMLRFKEAFVLGKDKTILWTLSEACFPSDHKVQLVTTVWFTMSFHLCLFTINFVPCYKLAPLIWITQVPSSFFFLTPQSSVQNIGSHSFGLINSPKPGPYYCIRYMNISKRFKTPFVSHLPQVHFEGRNRFQTKINGNVESQGWLW